MKEKQLPEADVTLTVVIPAKGEPAGFVPTLVVRIERGRVLDGVPLEDVIVVAPKEDPVLAEDLQGATTIIQKGPTKAAALNEALATVTSRYVIFIDADVDLQPGQLSEVYDLLVDGHPFVGVPYTILDALEPCYGWFFGADAKLFSSLGGWQEHYVEDCHTMRHLRRSGYRIEMATTPIRLRRHSRNVTLKVVSALVDWGS